MAKQLSKHLSTRPASRSASTMAAGLVGCLLLLAIAGCSGAGKETSGDHAGQINGPFQITPPLGTVFVGQSLQFLASSPWGSGAIWSVVPASGGSIDARGLFTAASIPGQYQIVAMWRDDVRYTAIATVVVLPLAPAAPMKSGLVQAFGRNLQTSPDGSLRNATIAGEPVPAKKAVTGTGIPHVRHGFYPPSTP